MQKERGKKTDFIQERLRGRFRAIRPDSVDRKRGCEIIQLSEKKLD
jgi:hypothetical protein